MALLRSPAGHESAFAVGGRGVWLRPLCMGDYPRWAELRALSRAHLSPREPRWALDELSRGAFRRRLRHYQKESREDQGYAFALLLEDGDRLIGGLSLSNVRRGVAQSASLGYWLSVPHAGRGHMTEAVRAILPFAFDTLRLHRVEAATMPDNAASIRVLERTGFVREGYARSYLEIDGAWRDHILFARLAGDGGREEARP